MSDFQVPSFDLSGKVAAVTGGNRGIGRSIALGLAAAGASVAILSRDERRNAAVVDEIERLGHKADAVRLDVTDRTALKPALDEVEARLGPIDILVNNAGTADISGGVLNQTEEGWDGAIAVHLTSTMLLSKAAAGHYAKANVEPGRSLVEFRLAEKEGAELAVGNEIKASIFEAGAIVDVTGTTIGKGFAGTMKRHNFAGGMKSHGNSVSHRAPGSIGQRQTPGRVFKGKRMSGHMGVVRRTTENLKVVEIDAERNLLLIRGAVPGAEGGQVIVRPSVKAARQKNRKKVAPSKINTGASNKK